MGTRAAPRRRASETGRPGEVSGRTCSLHALSRTLSLCESAGGEDGRQLISTTGKIAQEPFTYSRRY